MNTPIDISLYFPTLTERKLRNEILEKGTIFSFLAGDILMDYGRYISHIPLVLKGGLRILRQEGHNGREVFLYYLTTGQTCAMSLTCCNQQKTSRIKAIAETDTELLMIPVENMEIWLKQYPSWKNFIFETYQKSYDKLMDFVEELSFQQLDARVLSYLQQKITLTKNPKIQITHQEIANELNSSREVISRLLKKMEQDNKLELGRNFIVMKLM